MIRAGLSELTVSIRTIEDDVSEETETFELVLSVVDGPAVTGAVDRVTVTIVDDDEAPVVPELPEVVVVTATLRVSELSVSEGDTTTLNIELSEPTSEDVTLTLTVVAGGSADVTVDYEPLLVPVVIRAGLSELTVSIRTIDDNVSEETETFELVLSVVDGPAVTGAVDRVTVTILDDDQPAGITVTPITPVTEGDQIIVEVVLDAVSSDTVTVILVDAFTGSAEGGGVDYTLPVQLSEQITIGETRTIFRISTTLNDFLYEGDETVDLEFSVMGSSSVVPATALIRDADQAPTVSFAASQPTTVIEGSSVGILVRLDDAQLVSDLTVEFEVGLASTATSADYVVGSSVVIAAGEPFVMLTLTATSDLVYDGDVTETVELRLTGVSGGRLPGITLGSRTTHAVGIIDAQLPPLVSFAASQPTTVAEGSAVDILVELDGALTDDDVVVDFTVSGTAAEGVDYDSLGRQVTILGGDRTASIRLVARTDNRYDGDVTETVELVLTTASGGVTLSDPMTHAVTIIDNDTLPTLSLEGVVDASEDAGVLSLRAELSGALGEDVVLTLSVIGDVSNNDYLLTTPTLTIDAGAVSGTFEFEVIDDSIYEFDELVELSLSGETTGSVVLTLAPTSAIFRILDDDTAEIGFDPVTYEVGEASGTVTLTAKLLSGSLGRVVRLTYATSDDSARAGEDYSFSTGTVTLSPGVTEETFTVTIVNDDLYENTETFTVVLSGAPVGVVLTNAVAYVTITDDEPTPVAVIGFDSVTYSVSEEINRAVLTVSVISGALKETVTLSYTTVDGSAISGEDYELSTGMIELSPLDVTATIMVPVIDDTEVEFSEVFFVDLERVSVPDSVLLTPDRASVTIEDTDVEVGFEPVTYRVVEAAGIVELELEIIVIGGVLEETVTLSYETVAGSATSGVDYELSTGTVELSSQFMSATIMVRVVDDNVVDGTEVFFVELMGVGLPSNVSVLVSRAEVTIVDNDVEIGFDPVTYSVGEASGTVELKVSVLSGELTEPITLNYATSDGSAVAGTDYTLTTGTLTLSPGKTKETIVISILEDSTIEG